MELALLLYAASIADNLRSGMGAFVIALLLMMLIGCAVVFFSAINLPGDDKKDDDEAANPDPLKEVHSERYQNLLRVNRLGRRLVVVSFLCWSGLMLVSHLVPHRKDVYVMAGGYVALKAARSEVVQDTANNVLGSIEKWLDTELAKAEAEAAVTAAQTKKAGR